MWTQLANKQNHSSNLLASKVIVLAQTLQPRNIEVYAPKGHACLPSLSLSEHRKAREIPKANNVSEESSLAASDRMDLTHMAAYWGPPDPSGTVQLMNS